MHSRSEKENLHRMYKNAILEMNNENINHKQIDKTDKGLLRTRVYLFLYIMCRETQNIAHVLRSYMRYMLYVTFMMH